MGRSGKTIKDGEDSRRVFEGTPEAQEKRRCTAHSSRTGEPCRAWAVEGGTVCVTHGGRQQRAAIARRQNAEGIRAYLGDPDIVDPFDALLGEVHESAGNVGFYRSLIRELGIHPEALGENEEPLIETGLAVKKGIYGPDINGYESPHVLVKMYNDERDRLAKVSKMAIDCGIAERQVRLAERQGEMLVNIIILLLQDPRLQLSQEKQQMGRRVAGELMRRADSLIQKESAD